MKRPDHYGDARLSDSARAELRRRLAASSYERVALDLRSTTVTIEKAVSGALVRGMRGGR